MNNNEGNVIKWMRMYHLGVFRWRYAPVSVSVTNGKLIVKYWGLLKVRDVPLNTIESVSFSDKKWISKTSPIQGGLIMMRMNNPLVIVYKYKNNFKTDYFVGFEDHKQKLWELVTSNIGQIS